MTFRITTLSIKGLIGFTQRNDTLPLCLVSHFIYCYAEFRYAECHCAECHYAECHYAECRGAFSTLSSKELLLFFIFLLKWSANGPQTKSFFQISELLKERSLFIFLSPMVRIRNTIFFVTYEWAQ
jgi:hypothetical protein